MIYSFESLFELEFIVNGAYSILFLTFSRRIVTISYPFLNNVSSFNIDRTSMKFDSESKIIVTFSHYTIMIKENDYKLLRNSP